MNEIDRAFSFIASTLAADATLTPLLTGGAWQGSAPPMPDGTLRPTPYAVYGHQGGHDVIVQGGFRVMNDSLYRVIVWGPTGSYSAVSAAADELDKALSRKSGQAGTDGKALACIRQQPLSLDTVEDGVAWSGLGGIYRIYVQPADMSLQ